MACRQLIAEFVNAEHVEMRAMFYRSVRAIEHALSARREYLTKAGEILYGGPDHYARLAATKHFRDFLAAGRPPAPKQEEKRTTRVDVIPVERTYRSTRITPIRTGIRLFRHTNDLQKGYSRCRPQDSRPTALAAGGAVQQIATGHHPVWDEAGSEAAAHDASGTRGDAEGE